MQNPLVEMVERLSKIESYGIYIEDVNVEEKYKFDDEKKVTLTGVQRPAGEYYIVHINVMVAAHKPEDDGETLVVEPKSSPTTQGVYVPVQDDIPTCKHKRFNRLNVADPIIRGDIIFTEPKHDDNQLSEAFINNKDHSQSYREHLKSYNPKPCGNTCKKAIKTKPKYPDDIDNVVSAKPKTRKRKAN